MNIVGENFPSEIVKQINVRQKKKGVKTRDNQNLIWQNANTGWVKMISSIDINLNQRRMASNSEMMETITGKSSLAKQYVLFGGVYYQGKNKGGLSGGIARDKSILNHSAYGLGGLDLGLRPMPGVTSFSIKSENRGSLKTATIGIKCYNKQQFDIINTLYLSLGYSILIEWGNTMYYNNDGVFKEDINRYSLADEFLSGRLKWSSILDDIRKKRLESHGNYDAALGKVVNFSWTLNKDLSYDITLIVRTIGDVIESLKMNALSGYIPVDLNFANQFIQQTAASYTQANLTSFYNVVIAKKPLVQQLYDYMKTIGLDDLKARALLANILRESVIEPGSEITDVNGLQSGGLFHWNGPRFTNMKNEVGPNWKTEWKKQIDYALREDYGPTWKGASFTTAEEAANSWLVNWERSQNPAADEAKNNELLKLFPVDLNYSSVTGPPTVSSQNSATPTNSSATPQPNGYNTSAQVISKYACTHDVGSLFYNIMLELEKNPILNPTGASVDAIKISFDNNASQNQYYIRLGHFLQILEKNVIYQLKNSNTTNPSKIIKIDYDTDSNVILLYTSQVSANPASCIFKRSFKLSDGTPVNLFPDIDTFVLDENAGSANSTYSLMYGKIMNVYFNMRDVLEQMESSKNSETGILTLIDLLKILTRGFCNSTGNYNKIEPTIDEETNTIRFTDEVRLPEVDKIFKNQPKDIALFKMYGYWQTPGVPNSSEAGIVRDLSLTTTVSPKLATMITIGAQSNGYITGQDSTALSVMNFGLTDRVKEEWIEPASTITYPGPPPSFIAPNLPQSSQFLNFSNFITNLGSTTQQTQPTQTNQTALTGPPTLEQKYKNVLEAFNRFIQEMAANSWNQGDISAFSNSIQSFAEYNQAEATLKQRQSNAGISSPNIGFLPFDLTLTIDGLSGMKIYQKFVADTDSLPSNYPQSLEFLIKGITHEVKDNQWITKLESLAVPRDPFGSNSIFTVGNRKYGRTSQQRPSGFTTNTAPAAFTGTSSNTACGTTVLKDIPAPPAPTQVQIDAIKKAYDTVFYNGRNGADRMCGRWTYNIAYNYKQILKGGRLSKGADIASGDNADTETYRKELEKLGYTKILWGQNVTKDQMKELLNNPSNYGIFSPGDVINYFSSDRKTYHAQIYTGGYTTPGAYFASNKLRNFDKGFVYGNRPQNCYTLYLFKAPGSTVSSPPQPTTAGKSVTIGDSISVGIGSAFPNIKRIASLSQSSKNATWLLGELQKITTPYNDVENLVLSIGSNSLWDSSNSDNKLTNEIKRVFPNAALYILNGNYGWGGLRDPGTDWLTQINDYINVYKNAGFKVVGNITSVSQHPTNGDNLFKSFIQQLSQL